MSNENRDFLDEHFQATQPEQPETVEQDTPEVIEQQPEAQAQTVEQVPAQPEPEGTTPPEAKETGTVPYAAMKAEREKRQKLERELEEIRNRQQAAPAQPEQPAPTYYEDPEGYVQRVQNESTQRLYAALEASAREQYPDYDEAFAVVMKHAANNPAVVREVMTSANPAVAAYKMGKKLAEFEQMQDPDAYREKLKGELRAEWEAEQKAKSDQRQQAAAALPPDLSQARNTRGEFAAKDDVFTNLFERK